ncbi:DUF5979 domain-containing protein [Microbacterium sulfonylureivorans]|uniref:DUF5979 domain-containing protein n=1 Tax=Microbacterium sulfonylureivorans TaxID=2486854 RepID=UPI000FD97513|nr:DUF5979 domain-containing protein [Microbacterium sulfonylureivorans]
MNTPAHGRRRGIAMLAVLGVLAGLGATALTSMPTAPPAAADVGECPEGTLPGPGNTNPIWTDQNVAIYAGGDFQVRQQAAEAEGLVVVGGDASFDKATLGRFNVGWVGVGSGVAPFPGTTMLAVGGDVSVGTVTVLDVGANAFFDGQLLGGAMQVGGATIPDYEVDGSHYELNNGTLTQAIGPAAIEEWSDWDALIDQQSADLAALAPTGSVTPGALLTFAGDGASAQQVFTIAAATLNANPALNFTGIPDGATVVVNVTGGPVVWAPNYFADEGVRADDFASPLFGELSARTLWNFADATSVHLAGSSQVLGSILVPGVNPDTALPTLRVTASTNGRLFTNGTVLMDGVGNEHHNYPWLASPFECIPIGPDPVGSITVEKVLSPEVAALLPDGLTFHGIVTCPVDGGGELIVEWEVVAGEMTTVGGLPVGATCEITESLGPLGRVRLPPAGLRFDATRLSAWETPVWTVDGTVTPAPVEFVVPAPEDEAQVAIAVANALATGLFTITKVVEDPDGVGWAGDFTGAWQCAVSADPDADVLGSGTWTLAAGETSAAIGAPVGAWCSASETSPADPVGGSWGDPVVTPGAVLITVASAQTPIEIVVTNTLAEDLGAFTVTKTVAGEGAPDVAFTGDWSCELPVGVEVAAGSWSLGAGETSLPFAGPVGATCSVTEASPDDPADGAWGAPAISPASVVLTAESIETPLSFTVTNSFALLPGAFTIRKAVTGDGAPSATFTGAWSCELPSGTIVADGSWTLAAGEQTAPIEAPAGAVCEVVEDEPAGTDAGLWAPPVITGSPVEIAAGTAAGPAQVVVTNAFTRTGGRDDGGDDEAGGELPATGSTVPWWAMALGAGLIVAGAAAIIARDRVRTRG